MITRSTNRQGDNSFDRSFDRSTSRSSQNSSYNSRPNFRNNSNSFSSSNCSNQSKQTFNPRGNNSQNSSFTPANYGFQNRYDNNQGNKFDNRRKPMKYSHSRTQPKAQVIFEYMDQNPWDVIHMVRNFISYMKGNPAQRQSFKTNKLVPHRFNTEVNESKIQSSKLKQIQQAVN